MQMEWLDNMNRAIDYIETHLNDKMNYEAIAQTACCSVYHFQRMFTFMTDQTLSEYVRRRKMTQAAFELQNSAVKIVDIALKFGYDSPEAFTRAFQQLHGITPSAARKFGSNVKAFPRISFQLTVKGASEMNYKIVEKEAFTVYGIEGIFDTENGENLRAIPAFWGECCENGSYTKLVQSSYFPMGVNAVCGYRKAEGTRFPYMLCVLKTALSDPTGYTVVEVPKATWAIFRNEPHDTNETPSAVQGLTSRVFTDWLPTANYDVVDGFDFEMYYYHVDGSCHEEIWVRVKPRG